MEKYLLALDNDFECWLVGICGWMRCSLFFKISVTRWKTLTQPCGWKRIEVIHKVCVLFWCMLSVINDMCVCYFTGWVWSIVCETCVMWINGTISISLHQWSYYQWQPFEQYTPPHSLMTCYNNTYISHIFIYIYHSHVTECTECQHMVVHTITSLHFNTHNNNSQQHCECYSIIVLNEFEMFKSLVRMCASMTTHITHTSHTWHISHTS